MSVLNRMGDILDELIIRRRKERDYREYIQKHISNVSKAYNQYFVPLLYKTNSTELTKAIVQANNNINTHDASKYSKEEFDAYRIHFYPTKREESIDNQEDFDKAWEHHYKNNKHHPQYWNYQDMSLEYIIEMICDWLAMSMYYRTSLIEWWKSDKTQQKEASYMSEYTKRWVEIFLYELLPSVNKKHL